MGYFDRLPGGDDMNRMFEGGNSLFIVGIGIVLLAL